jgi:hypothetical protein
MSKKTALLNAILMMVLVAACSETGRRGVGPSPLSTADSASRGALSAGVQTSPVAVRSISGPTCPTLPPLVASFNLNVQAPGDVPVSVRHITMSFTDTNGLTAPSVTLPAPVLTRQFGSTLVQARSQRAFPLTFPFGCGTAAGTLVVVVVVGDDLGRETTAQVTAAVR